MPLEGAQDQPSGFNLVAAEHRLHDKSVPWTRGSVVIPDGAVTNHSLPVYCGEASPQDTRHIRTADGPGRTVCQNSELSHTLGST